MKDSSMFPDMVERIVELMRLDIRNNGRPGQQLDTIRVLCNRYGVSANTIRAALRLLKRDGLIQTWQGSRSIIKEASPLEVGVYMEFDVGDVTSSFYYRRVATQVRRCLEQKGYLTRFYNGFLIPGEHPDLIPRDFLKDVKDHRISGLAILSGESYVPFLEQLRSRHVPTVGGKGPFDVKITHDYGEMVRAGVIRLIKEGRRNLAMLGWVQPAGRHQPTDTKEIFEAVLAEYGIPLRPEWIRVDLHPSSPGAGWSGFREIWASSSTKPDGLLVCDDMLFADAVPAILSLQVDVPDKLLIVTHAVEGARMHYPFPVLRMVSDPDEYAAAVAGALANLIEGRPQVRTLITLPFNWGDRSRAGDALENFPMDRTDMEVAGNETDMKC